MANSKKILVKESEEELLKLKIKQPAHLKKRIVMLLILKRSEVSLSKNELSTLLKINHNTVQSWRDLYFRNGIDGLLTYGRIGFKPSIISSDLHKALEARLNSYVKRHFKAKLKVARKSHIKKDEQAVESFKKTSSKF